MYSMYEDNSEAFANEDLYSLRSNEDLERTVESNPVRRVGKWTKEEDEILKEMVMRHRGKNWKKIAEQIKGRTSIQCLHRWSKILQPGLVKGPWAIEEDRKLIEWVRKEGASKWSQCAEFISGRNGKQCRERWFNNLNPNVKKGEWTLEEDHSLFFYYKTLGGKWSQIKSYFSGRSENSIKNRFYSTLRRFYTENKKYTNENNLSKLDELKKFIILAQDDIKDNLIKRNKFSEQDFKNYESNLLKTIEVNQQIQNKNKFSKLTKSMLCDLEDSKNSFIETKNNQIETPKLQQTVNNYNINVNINSNEAPFSNYHSEYNNTNLFLANDMSQYKSMDIYSLERDIAGMCESSFFFGDDNFNDFKFNESNSYNTFNLDSQVDNILESIFTNNNIVLTNDPNKECNVCHTTNEKEKDEIEILESKLKTIENDKPKENKAKEKTKKSEKSREVYQNLLSQLNGLEKLVKNAKKELSKFENCGEDLNVNSLENLFK